MIYSLFQNLGYKMQNSFFKLTGSYGVLANKKKNNFSALLYCVVLIIRYFISKTIYFVKLLNVLQE